MIPLYQTGGSKDRPILAAKPHYKQCRKPGSYRGMVCGDYVVCPGCDRTCGLPDGVPAGIEFKVIKE